MTLTFKKLKPNRIFQSVVDQIQAAIIDGSLKPGDLLPSEMKLKDMFDTSRGTVREALRVLEQKGLVEIKTGVGGGAVVKAADTRALSEGLDLLIQCRKVSLEQLAEFREAVEGMVTGLAAQRAEPADVKRLKGYAARFARLLKHRNADWRTYAELDSRFHIAIAELTGNPVFTAVLQMVHENILGHWEGYFLRGTTVLEENYRDICGMIQAIESGKADRARTLAQQHVLKFKSHLERVGGNISDGEGP